MSVIFYLREVRFVKVEELKILISPEIKNTADLNQYVNTLKKAFESFKFDPKIAPNFKKTFDQLLSDIKAFEDASNAPIIDQKGYNKLKNSVSEVGTAFNDVISIVKKIPTTKWTELFGDPAQIANLTKNLETVKSEYQSTIVKQQDYIDKLKEIKTEIDRLQSDGNKSKSPTWANLINDLSAGNIDNITKYIGNLGRTKKDISDLTTLLNELISIWREGAGEVDKATAALENAKTPTDEVTRDLESIGSVAPDVQKAFKNIAQGALETGQASLVAAKDVDHLVSRLTQFLSLGNAILLFRRTVRSAFNTVKELDAAMTETATVTDYSVSDMWDKLDEYTAIANKLGATTLGTYKTITLFFQQGLDEQQSLALATETMKMARVANIDYAEATQYMTSALRGFNMELNETSATRVNDVYSELAKITAADTNQIAVAMSKVASLANSANMELETTSAFLSQIIETTQEAPETAGTALKTIIARFSEVKKLYSEGELTGTDEEGETIDVNKIGSALRMAGIDLNRFITGQVGLDEIFIELSEKWDSLDLVTQRYIATMAAGSRQQSRFIALMQNYDRTLELVNAAYASAGSGQQQFEKTLESLEAKLNKLKNSWHDFTMSIANSGVIKKGVDTLNGLLTVVNRLTDAFGPLSGVVKLFVATGIFKMGRNILGPAFDAYNTIIKANQGKLTPEIYTQATQAGLNQLGSGAKSAGASIAGFFAPAGYKDAKQLYKDIEDGKASVMKTINGVNTELSKTEALEQATAYQAQALGRGMQQAGVAIILVGQALSTLGAKLDNEALQTAGKWISYIGAATTGLGTLAQVLPSVASMLGITTKAAAGLLGVFTLFAVAIGVAINVVQKYHQHTKDLYNSSITLKEAINDVAEGMHSLDSMQDTLQGLTKGSAAWYLQLANIKDKIEEIIKEHPEAGQFLHFDSETGYYFDEDEYTEWQKKSMEQSDKRAQISAIHNTKVANGGYGNLGYYNDLDEAAYGDMGSVLDTEDLYDVKKLRDIFKISSDYVSDEYLKEQVQRAQELAAATSAVEQREYVEQETGLTDIREDELPAYYIETLLRQYLQDALEYSLNPSGFTRIEDYRGQNTQQANFNATDEQLTNQLNAKIVSDEEAKALEKYWNTLKDLPDILETDAHLIKILALDTAQAVRTFKSFSKVLSDNADILKSNVRDSTEYQVALGKVITAAKEAFGEKFDENIITADPTLFIDAFVEGSEDAVDQIREKISASLEDDVADLGINFDIPEEDVSFLDYLQDFLAQDHDFQVTGSADISELFNNIEMSQQQLQGLNDIIKALGFELAFKETRDANGNITGIQAVVHDTAKTAVRNARAAGSKKGGGSSKKEKAWENPYDQLYNLTELNEEAIRKRNLLEKQYNAILRDREGTQKQLTNNSLQELANLQQQLAYQRQLQAGREKQLAAVTGEMYTDSEGNRKSYADWGVTQYASYNRATNAVEIDWNAIDKVTDQTKGKAIEDYIKRLEELQKLFEETDSNILDIEEEIDEINDRGKTTYLDFEQEIYDAIVNNYQKTIDEFSSLNDTINEANDRIMNGLQEQIDLERQIRDNTKTEEEIGDKEARLAYLQRDTSGANAVEALRLQEEIANARQSYADSLIDQRLQQLQKDNDEAAEQRQTQITLMQSQLNYWAEQGVFWKDVDTLLQNAFDPETGELANNSALVDLLKGENNFKGLSEFGKAQWKDELVKKFMESMEGYGSWMMEKAEQEGTITQGGNTYTYDKSKKAWMLGNEAYSAVYDAASGQYIFTRNKTEDVKTGKIGEPKEEIKADKEKESQGSPTPPPPPSTPVESYTVTYNNGEWSTTVKAKSEADAINMASELYKKAKGFGINFPATAWKGRAVATKLNGTLRYASGGFADYTGPAWLDGSKSKPEAVLSAKQTELFISLRDMLEKFGQTGGFNNAMGNTYVDLDVNADIGSDYDVDSLVNRLKRDILDSSSYRNVNMLSRGH